ncbi:shikimate dehydrogenase [Campylobacter sp. 19-13652]|uniref:shikimate dehydrogenase n=1 Tax=Campylobacter sp. 19-13652 TaxID=2840180 RepID=UPI001C77654C|nr:shikimate dehydrogenase [Campylobacter sp. 19-13652]BCX79765.1 shikimate dehydrogenase (NADP(+)) [Campylobacter sp. 19-13652]
MRLFALFGDPVAHSLSPRLHNSALNALGLSGAYIRYLLKDGDTLIDKFKRLGLSGANITVPHKHVAAMQADVKSEFVLKVGAANTLVQRDDKIYAFNTDAPGFLRAISKFSDVKKVLVLGAGGTALALAHALKDSGADVSVLNRSKSRLASFETDFRTFTWESFEFGDFDLVLNTTSAGLKDELLPAPSEILRPALKHARYAFDVIYGKETPFLQMAKSLNIPNKDGADMLLFQAVLAFNLFFDNTLKESSIINSMREAFSLPR